MKKIVIDIETAGFEFNALDPLSQEYMLKYANSIEECDEVMESLSFYPVTGQVVAIGMLEVDSDQGFVLYQNQQEQSVVTKEGSIQLVSAQDEKTMLKLFWNKLKDYRRVVTFNGRGFDCPFLMVRSAINEVKPSMNLMPNRYSSDVHIDLLDRLTFYGSVRKKFSLHMWCKAFGIESPKEGEVTGHQVKDLFREGKYLDIARYCVGDIVATKKLFLFWDQYLNS